MPAHPDRFAHAPSRRDCLRQAAALSFAALPGMAGAAGRNAVVLSLSLAPDSLDPTMAAASAVGEVSHYNIFEGLTRIEEDGQVAPLLARSWSLSPDQRSWRFDLRRGVRFHDGKPLTAQVVRASFERCAAPGSTNKARRAVFDNIATIATPDEHTVVLTLHHRDPDLPFRLGEATTCILHPDSAAHAATRPVGTGPYRLAQWSALGGVVLTRTGSWHPAQHAPLAQATFRFIADPAEQEAALAAGEVDLLFQFATRVVRRFQDDRHYQVLIGHSCGKGMLALNHRRAPLNDVRVRQAITHAIDREGFIREVLDGRGSAIGSHFAPTDPGFLHLDSLLPYDPARARALLREAGVRTPLRLNLALPPAPYALSGGDRLAANLADVGIDAPLQRLDWKTWLDGPFKGDFDMTLINHVEPLDYRIYTDPSYYFGVDDPVFRSLVQQHDRTPSPRERQRLWAQMQRRLAETAANAWIFTPQIGTVVRKGLRGVWMNYPIFAHDIGAMSWE